MDQINECMTRLDTATTNIGHHIRGTEASMNVDGTNPVLLHADTLGEPVKNILLHSGRQGMGARSILSELFAIHDSYYITRAQNNLPGAHAELDRFEAQYTMFCDSCERFAAACKNMATRR
jgi:hypothetical protein